MIRLFHQLWAGKKDLLLVGSVVSILLVLFIPIPPLLLDVLLIVNLSVALLILLLTFYTSTPLKFSTFPSLLLMATLFRLALNISATRLILNHGNAGHVIDAVGKFVVGGNYVIGLVVFLILVVVQYVVVTNGAQRVAEVAARFTLDSMPGKQMAIDADMNMGLIDADEARRRRAHIEKEANFYGAMDGATKFVKGDAVAGIIIVLINVVGGLTVGIAQRGLSWSDALATYTLLTVGDGIVTQIPSLVVAVATGIIITRAATDAQLGEEISRQVLAQPRTLLIIAIALLAMLILPGLPALPVLVVFAGVVALVIVAGRHDAAVEQAEPDSAAAQKPVDDVYAQLPVEPLELRFGQELATAWLKPGDDLTERLEALRRQYANDYGFVVPTPKVEADPRLGARQYSAFVHGARIGTGELRHDQVMAISPGGRRPALEGSETREPTYGLPAQWIAEERRQFARGAGYTLVDPKTVLLTHLGELLRRHAPDLLTRAETERLLGRVRQRQPALYDELIPTVLSLSDLQKVLQHLLREKVSIRNVEAILEVLVDHGKSTKIAEDLTERVRERLGPSICQSVADAAGEVHVLTLAPDLERMFLGATRQKESGAAPLVDAAQLEQFLTSLARQAEAMMGRSLPPVLLCPAPVRRHVRRMIQRALPHVTVLGLTEVPPTLVVRSFGTVALAPSAAAA